MYCCCSVFGNSRFIDLALQRSHFGFHVLLADTAANGVPAAYAVHAATATFAIVALLLLTVVKVLVGVLCCRSGASKSPATGKADPPTPTNAAQATSNAGVKKQKGANKQQ